MLISGLQKLTLLDFPGRTACTLFTPGCNYRCPFCHNASLVARAAEQPPLDTVELFAFLLKRRIVLDGVAISGGEPTLQHDLPDFLARLRELGYAVKLDTNGTNPAMLREILARGLADYIAMDIKASPENYARTAGVPVLDLAPVRESAALLMDGRVPFEFRTTAVKELHTVSDFEAIGQWLRGPERYFIQCFRDSGDVLMPGFSAPDRAALQSFLAAVREYIPAAELRGVD